MGNKHHIVFLSHGGGPMPLLGDEGHVDMVACLQKMAKNIQKPSAILVISAHWEESIATITAGKSPPLIYDYYGFSQESYEISYPCPGEPMLANRVHHRIYPNLPGAASPCIQMDKI